MQEGKSTGEEGEVIGAPALRRAESLRGSYKPWLAKVILQPHYNVSAKFAPALRRAEYLRR